MTGFDIYEHLRERPSAHMTCPHCNGVGGVEQNKDLILVCKLCGAPRILMPEGVALDPVTVAALRKAEAARKRRGLMGGLGVVSGVLGSFGLFIVLLTWLFTSLFWASIPFLLFVAPAIAAVLYARSARANSKKELEASLDAAWIAAGTELMRSGKVKNGADLSKVLGLDPLKAQQVMNLLSVDAAIGAHPQLRIDAPVVAQVPEDPRFAALESKVAAEAQAEAEANAALGSGDARAKGSASH